MSLGRVEAPARAARSGRSGPCAEGAMRRRPANLIPNRLVRLSGIGYSLSVSSGTTGQRVLEHSGNSSPRMRSGPVVRDILLTIGLMEIEFATMSVRGCTRLQYRAIGSVG